MEVLPNAALASQNHSAKSINVSVVVQAEDPWVVQLLSVAHRLGSGSTNDGYHRLDANVLDYCVIAGDAHEERWDQRTSGEKLQASLSCFLRQAQYSSHHAQYKFYSKTGNKIRNIAADTFKGRTSTPHFVTEKYAFPPPTNGDDALLSVANKAMHLFRAPEATKQQTVSGNKQHYMHYLGAVRAKQTIADSRILEASGIVRLSTLDEAKPSPSLDVESVFRWVWDDKWLQSAWGGHAPEPRENLGREFHMIPAAEAAVQLVIVALHGNRIGPSGWRRFNRVLVQGGWPWIVGYTKAFAKAVWILLVSLFEVVEHHEIPKNFNIGSVMFNLASLLIGRPDNRGGSQIRIRTNDRLTDAKTKVYGIKLSNPDQKETLHADKDASPMKNKEVSKSTKSLGLKSKSSKAETKNDPPVSTIPGTPDHMPTSEGAVKKDEAKGWVLTMSTDDDTYATPPKDLPSHIVTSSKCNHGENVAFVGYVRGAYCLSDLDEKIDETSITVAQTLGREEARNEALEYAIEKSVLTVRRAEFQCIYCAYRLAHCIGAPLVIG